MKTNPEGHLQQTPAAAVFSGHPQSSSIHIIHIYIFIYFKMHTYSILQPRASLIHLNSSLFFSMFLLLKSRSKLSLYISFDVANGFIEPNLRKPT